MDYYEEIINIVQVNEKDEIVGPIERWKAHKENILHRALTIAIFFGGKVLLQHRKHPVFNSVFDMYISTHQIYDGERLIDDNQSIGSALKREFDINYSDLIKKPQFKGKVMYQFDDPQSKFFEREICYLYSCETKTLPQVNYDFAYGFSLMDLDELKQHESPVFPLLAPWVKEIINNEII